MPFSSIVRMSVASVIARGRLGEVLRRDAKLGRASTTSPSVQFRQRRLLLLLLVVAALLVDGGIARELEAAGAEQRKVCSPAASSTLTLS